MATKVGSLRCMWRHAPQAAATSPMHGCPKSQDRLPVPNLESLCQAKSMHFSDSREYQNVVDHSNPLNGETLEMLMPLPMRIARLRELCGSNAGDRAFTNSLHLAIHHVAATGLIDIAWTLRGGQIRWLKKFRSST